MAEEKTFALGLSSANDNNEYDRSDDQQQSNNTLNNGNNGPNAQGNSTNGEDDDICRDYLRNVCRRGQSCKYRHPDESEAMNRLSDFVFCHDFQNRECRRQNCRFVHATKAEEESYRANGSLPPHLMDKMVQMKGYGDLPVPGDTIPICKDYLKGECRRGTGRCKFRHLSQREADMELGIANSGPHSLHVSGHAYGSHVAPPPPLHQDSHRFAPHPTHAYGHQPLHHTNGNHHLHPGSYPPQHVPPPPHGHHGPPGHYAPGPLHQPSPGLPTHQHPNQPVYPPVRGYGRRDPYCDPVYAPPEKKPRPFDHYPGLAGQSVDEIYSNPGTDPNVTAANVANAAVGPASNAVGQLATRSVQSYALEDENAALRRRVEDLKKQVADLMATNEFLLEQNAQLRSLTKSNGASISAGATVTPGTVTALAAVAGPGATGVTPVGVTTATVELPVVSIASLSAVTGLPVSSIAASLSSAIISSSSSAAASVNSGTVTSAALVSYPHLVATATTGAIHQLKTEYHNSLTR